MERDLSLLADIRGMAEDAIAFLGDRSLQELHQDKQLQYALIRCLEVIGEAANRFLNRLVTSTRMFPGLTMQKPGTFSFTRMRR